MEVTGSCTFEGGFQKGMTLEQYMLCGDRGRNTVKQEERKDEESLYDNCRQISLKSSNKLMVNYCINEIDEESYEESTDYFYKDKTVNDELLRMFPSKPGELQTDVRRNRKDQMHLTAYHPRITPEHDSFRIKNIVYSHNKKYPVVSTSHTLYGKKFRQSSSNTKQSGPRDYLGSYNFLLMSKKQSLEKRNEKYFKKKNNIYLNDIIEYEKNLQNNYSQRINNYKIDSIKEQLRARRSRIQ